MLANRRRAVPLGLFFMARLERVLANLVSGGLRFIRRVGSRVIRR